MIERSQANAFAREWIDAWNAHDLERILAHYAEGCEMRSPFIVERLGVADGRQRGKQALRAYWSLSLAIKPPLRFELRDVFVGAGALAILYENIARQRLVIEAFEFDLHNLIVRAEAFHKNLA